MKNLNKIFLIALAAAGVSSCADLDTQYYGTYVTDEQKQNALESNPDLADAAVSAVFTQFGAYQGQYGGSSAQYDFGYPTIMIGLDQQTADVAAPNTGYNWFDLWSAYSSPTPNGNATGLTWIETYKQINIANSLISTISLDTEVPALQFSLAQGLATRAFDYWLLAQLYQYNYVGHEESPCVPIITDVNADEVAANGAPRAKVQEVYDLILTDLNNAITLIAKSGLSPESVAAGKPQQMVSLAVAYGLRARVYLTMHKYAEAAADAQSAIDAFSGTPMTAEEISVPGFDNVNHAWMWAICIAETDRPITSGLCNFGAMFGSFCFGYPLAGDAWRWCNKLLWESIPATDARKGWWLDEKYQSDHLSPTLQAFLNEYINPKTPTTADGASGLRPYTNVKHGLFNGPLGEYVGAFDVPLMRIEEMYYILAEATGMSSSVAEGKNILEKFVKAYRDPAYTCSATDKTAFQDEVWHQRRIEFWGEGLAYFDLQRLGKPVDRVGGAFPDGYNYQIPADSPVRIYCIPQSELTANPQITAAQNNESGTRPTPIPQ